MIRSLVSKVRQSLRTQKLSQDIAYSLGSFAILAVSGIVINVTVMSLRDAAALGVFNIAYAVYIVVSQFAVWGLHYSVLRHAAYHRDEPAELGKILFSACLCSIGMGTASAALIILAKPMFASAFSNEVTVSAIQNAALGLAIFPVNKILLAYLNGLRRMKAFAALQAVRYLAVMAMVAGIAASAMPIDSATYCFLFAELLTVLLAAAYIIKKKLTGPLKFDTFWVKRHYQFGSKALAAGMFTEVNSRVDVLMIGLFMNEHATGIYSFAAMLVDGVYQILAMVRINFNPLLVAVVQDKEWTIALHLRRQAQKLLLPSVALLGITLTISYYIFTKWLIPPEKDLIEGVPSLIILLAGLTAVCVFIPFDNLMLVSGHPGFQAIQQAITVIVNAGIAALLLPHLGIEGAAFGTAISYVVGAAALVYLAHRIIGWNLISNTIRS